MTPNPLTAQVQRRAAYAFILLYAVVMVGPMVGWKPADPQMVENLKNVTLILIGWLWGSSANGAKKDETIAAQLPQGPQ